LIVAALVAVVTLLPVGPAVFRQSAAASLASRGGAQALAAVHTGLGNSSAASAALPGRLVVARSAPGGRSFATLAPDGTTLTPLPIGGPVCCNDAELSPQGSRLAFAGEGSLYVSDSNGTGGKLLWPDPISTPVALAWSPQGSEIAFVANDSSGPSGIAQSALYIIGADGSRLHRVANGLNIRSIAWAPDGSEIAFTANQGDIFAVNSSGGVVRTLFGTAQGETGNELPWTLSWSPGGAGRAELTASRCTPPSQPAHYSVILPDPMVATFDHLRACFSSPKGTPALGLTAE